MTKTQFEIFEKMLINGRPAKVGKYTFVISRRNGTEYQLSQMYETSNLILKIGTFEQCFEVAKECFNMMFMD